MRPRFRFVPTFGSSISCESACSSDWPCLPLGHCWSLRFQFALLSRTMRMFGGGPLLPPTPVKRSMSSAAAGSAAREAAARAAAQAVRTKGSFMVPPEKVGTASGAVGREVERTHLDSDALDGGHVDVGRAGIGSSGEGLRGDVPDGGAAERVAGGAGAHHAALLRLALEAGHVLAARRRDVELGDLERASLDAGGDGRGGGDVV